MMRYSATSETTKKLCEEIGYSFEMQFVKTTVSKTGYLYANYTLAKPEELNQYYKALKDVGFESGKHYFARRPLKRVTIYINLKGKREYEEWIFETIEEYIDDLKSQNTNFENVGFTIKSGKETYVDLQNSEADQVALNDLQDKIVKLLAF